MSWNGVTLRPVEGCKRLGSAGLGVLEPMCFVDNEDGPRQTVKKGYGTPRGIK